LRCSDHSVLTPKSLTLLFLLPGTPPHMLFDGLSPRELQLELSYFTFFLSSLICMSSFPLSPGKTSGFAMGPSSIIFAIPCPGSESVPVSWRPRPSKTPFSLLRCLYTSVSYSFPFSPLQELFSRPTEGEMMPSDPSVEKGVLFPFPLVRILPMRRFPCGERC